MNTIEILKGARVLIAYEKNWTQGLYARNEDGETIDPTSPEAICFCSMGALRHIAGISISQVFSTELREELVAAFGCSLGEVLDYNDHKSHADVLALFDRAIARAESEAV